MSDLHPESRSARLDRALAALLGHNAELEAAAVVSFDGLPMASALPEGMDEDRVAAMSAALLSLGERAATGLGRGELSQVWIEGATGTVFLVSADDEAVLVAVAAQGAKTGLMMYEVRRAAAAVGAVLRDVAEPETRPDVPSQAGPVEDAPRVAAVPAAVPAPPAEPLLSVVPPSSSPAPVPDSSPLPASVAPSWTSSYTPPGGVLGALGGSVLPVEPPRWS